MEASVTLCPLTNPVVWRLWGKRGWLPSNMVEHSHMTLYSTAHSHIHCITHIHDLKFISPMFIIYFFWFLLWITATLSQSKSVCVSNAFLPLKNTVQGHDNEKQFPSLSIHTQRHCFFHILPSYNVFYLVIVVSLYTVIASSTSFPHITYSVLPFHRWSLPCSACSRPWLPQCYSLSSFPSTSAVCHRHGRSWSVSIPM